MLSVQNILGIPRGHYIILMTSQGNANSIKKPLVDPSDTTKYTTLNPAHMLQAKLVKSLVKLHVQQVKLLEISFMKMTAQLLILIITVALTL